MANGQLVEFVHGPIGYIIPFVLGEDVKAHGGVDRMKKVGGGEVKDGDFGQFVERRRHERFTFGRNDDAMSYQ